MTITQEHRAVHDFDEIRMELMGEIIIIQDDTEDLLIEAEPGLLAHIKSDVNDGRLELGLKHWFDVIHLFGGAKVRCTVHVKKMTGIQLLGSGTISAARIEGDRLRVKMSGSGEIKLADVQASDLEVDFSGSGKAEIAGVVQRYELGISGSGEILTGQLESQDVRVRISGSGKVHVNAQKSLNVFLSGSGEIRYHGQPTIEHRISGSGSIRPE